jgi:molybdopterin-binding protein
VSYSTIKQWIYKGSLRTVRTAGGHYRVAEREIGRLLAAGAPRRAGRAAASAAPRRRQAMLASLSGRNQLRGVVEEVRVEGLMAQVRLAIGDQRLTAVITRDAVDALRLRRGHEAVAVIKATEVMIGRY